MLEVAVEIHLFHLLYGLPELVAQRAGALVVRAHLQLRQARRLAEADDLVRGERTGAESALVPAAVDLRLDAHARLAPHIKGADALRAIHLVRCDGEKVGLELLHVDLEPAAALHRIAMEDDSL